MANNGRRVSKADFVWTLLELARTDREAYRELRERGWLEAEEYRVAHRKSEFPN